MATLLRPPFQNNTITKTIERTPLKAESSLVVATNNIVKLSSRSKNEVVKIESEFKTFSSFLKSNIQELLSQKLPDRVKIRRLSNLNLVDTFGTPGGLLTSLASGALDVAGLLGDMFPGKGKKMGTPPGDISKTPKPTPKGSRLRFGGVRALPILNTIFTGLDFATGLASGESVGKAAAGAGGSLAGSLLGGAIGQALIPVPGLGFIIGSAAGSFLGGFAGDRAYGAVSGEEKTQEEKASEFVKKRLEEDRSKKERESKLKPAVSTFKTSVEEFDKSTTSFEEFVSDILSGKINLFTAPQAGTKGGAKGGGAPGEAGTEGGVDLGKSMRPGETIQEHVAGVDAGGFIQGSSGEGMEDYREYGVHFHLSPPSITPEGFAENREIAFTAVKLMHKRGSRVTFSNIGDEVAVKDNDSVLKDQIRREQLGHTKGGRTQGGIDIQEHNPKFPPTHPGIPGARIPFPLKVTNVSQDISSGYGREARVVGSNVILGHGAKGSANSPVTTTPPTPKPTTVSPAPPSPTPSMGPRSSTATSSSTNIASAAKANIQTLNIPGSTQVIGSPSSQAAAPAIAMAPQRSSSVSPIVEFAINPDIAFGKHLIERKLELFA
jgi:hypothetical protein